MTPTDPYDPGLVVKPEGLLGEFNAAGVLAPVDVHVASRLAKLGGEQDQAVLLAVALAVRAPRFGHVRVPLRELRSRLVADVEDPGRLDSLPWPDPKSWIEALSASPLVATGPDGPMDRPLRLIDGHLYTDRQWRDESLVSACLSERAAAEVLDADETLLDRSLERILPGPRNDDQRHAANLAIRRRLSIITGGPGSGKTTTVAGLLAVLYEQASAMGRQPPLVALAAPTGKAAARLEEAVRGASGRLDIEPAVRRYLATAEGLTLHRLLRRRPDNPGRFRHSHNNPLPHDVVVIDETSMVSLALMARLLEAVRPNARLVLVGDPDQLDSIEAGAVLADIVRPIQSTEQAPPQRPQNPPPISRCVAALGSSFRFEGVLAELAGSVRSGDADTVIALLAGQAGAFGVSRAGDRDEANGFETPALCWINADPGCLASQVAHRRVGNEAGQEVAHQVFEELDELREVVVEGWSAVVAAAMAGDGRAALSCLRRTRILCAHRFGLSGVAAWTEIVESWLSMPVTRFDPISGWYPGRPVLITANDYGLRLFNGDIGVTVMSPGETLSVVFERGGSVQEVSPSRLAGVETAFAMTVHKAQGSEFDQVVLLLPPSSSPLATRELLYTAVTRARRSLLLVGSEQSVRESLSRRVERASGIASRIWGRSTPAPAQEQGTPAPDPTSAANVK